MKSKNQPYHPTLDDEIDWKIIDQLHFATSKFSSASTEMKKLYFVLLGITIPGIIKLSGDKLDLALFVAVLITTILFYYLDAYTYYYQELLRSKMDKHFEQIKSRHSVSIQDVSKKQEFTLSNERTSKDRWIRAFTNSSVRIYPTLLLLTIISLALFVKGVI